MTRCSFAVLSLLAAIAGCDNAPATSGSFGRPCDDDGQCRRDAPRCVALAAPDYAPGICATDCAASGACPSGSECHAGSCIRCASSIVGTVPAGEACGCDTDCAEGTCEMGLCAVDCRHSPCPSGMSCEGSPATCHACLGGSPRPEAQACSCDLDCASGLRCIGDLCLRACDFDEMCGADECRHEVLVPPACGAQDGACVGAGTGAPGSECACNADCGTLSPLCVGAFLGGARAGRCGQPCGPEMPCPGGTACCSVVIARAYCMTPEVVDAYDASCL